MPDDSVPGYPLLWQRDDVRWGDVCIRGHRIPASVVGGWAAGEIRRIAEDYGITEDDVLEARRWYLDTKRAAEETPGA